MVAAVVLGLAIAMGSASAPVTWELADPIPHVFDVGGPLSDGSLLAAAGGKLFLLDSVTGAQERFAGGQGGYPGAGGEEPYIAVTPIHAAAHTTFQRDNVFVLQLKPAGGILRIDSAGVAHQFANVDGVDSLNGITFDQTGAFGFRLLVTGSHAHHTIVAAIDGDGNVSVITREAPTVEGGIAVAPAGFGRFGGDLIAPDELSGYVYAIAPDGFARVVARPDLARGGDTGVEAAGFIPDGDLSTLTVYFADRGTPGNAHPGTDNLLALNGAALARRAVKSGDLLLATEGGAGVVVVRCDMTSCQVTQLIADNGTSHGEGHILVVAGRPGQAFGPAPAAVRSSAPVTPPALLAALIAGALVLVMLASAVLLRRSRSRS